MIKLQDVYPLYLNNKAVQPNADLAVTDKFTGEVAFHTALATPDIIDAAIAGAVRAAEPFAAMASYERQAVLEHCVKRFRERFDELAWALCVEAGKKKVVLELGGNAAVVVDADADLDHALERVIFGGYYQSGQSCIHVQRVIVHEAVYETFRDRLTERVKALRSGDPKDRATFIGPMISAREAQRLKGWVDAAVAGGGRLLAGGGCEGAMLEATLIENCPTDADLYREEAFGPAVILSRFSDWDAALAEVNDSKFGLQAGLFTRDIHKVLEAWDRLEVGGVVVNDVSSFRVDNMPYGGVKDSGLGREGVRFAIEDMTEIRNLVIRRA